MEENKQMHNVTIKMKGNFPKEIVVEAHTTSELSQELLVQAYYEALYQLYSMEQEYQEEEDEELENEDDMQEKEKEQEPAYLIESNQRENMTTFKRIKKEQTDVKHTD